MASSRLVSQKALARRTPLLSFLAREHPAAVSAAGEIVAVPFSSPINPFAPSKATPAAKSWTAPKYSIRRQKALRIEASLYGLPQEILPPPFIKQSPQSPSNPKNEQQRLLKGSNHVPATRILDQLAMQKPGPYAGRKGAAFKGKIWERKKEQRTADLKRLLDSADAKAQAWKKANADARVKSKPALPF
ncbi:mitochondrial 54S ribosomal protein mL59 MRPL25 [Sporobolomyces koalae]|uniref:mitochondrial 54S ribosomal protein mL59 MRPL25 n=1 Tax=Sporobolomyces koalae TaxID=500713 RepID=UPI00317C830B